MSENENMMSVENPYEFAVGSPPPSLIYDDWTVDWSLTIRLIDGTDFRSEGNGASPALFEGLWQSLLHAVMEEPNLTGGFMRSEELCRWLTIA